MAPLILSPEQRLELEYFAAHTTAANERSRARALLWRDQGESAEQVAELLLVSRRTVDYWVDRFQARSGFDLPQRLADAPRSGRPWTGGADLWIAQVIDTDSRDPGYLAIVRTAPLLRQYLRDRHDIEVSRKTVSRAIARLAVRWKRPRYQLALRPATRRQAKGG
jgi:transposase